MSDAIQDFYPDDFARCFGCGRLNESGYRIKTRRSGEGTSTEFTPAVHHTALPGFVYGGLIASLIDCHSTGSAAIFAVVDRGEDVGSGPSPRFVTAHLEIDYLHPTPLEPLQIMGRLVEIKGRKVTVDSEMISGGRVTARGRAVLVGVPEGFAAR